MAFKFKPMGDDIEVVLDIPQEEAYRASEIAEYCRHAVRRYHEQWRAEHRKEREDFAFTSSFRFDY